jgi:hypothetical protein
MSKMKKITIQGNALALTPSGGIDKESVLKLWQTLKPGKLKPEPIPYKHSGSTIEQDGIRICGSPEFIGAVMERLKDLLEYEGQQTRLGIAFSELSDKQGRKIEGRFRCAIQVHERGRQATFLQKMFEPAVKKTLGVPNNA